MPSLHSCTRAAAASPVSAWGLGSLGVGRKVLGLRAIITVRNVPYISLRVCRISLFGFLLNKVELKARGEG